jgi:hypothetical protein
MAYTGGKYYPDYVKQGGVLTPEQLKEFKIILPVTCDKCGKDFDIEGPQIFFCPNCGAKLPPYGALIIDAKTVHDPLPTSYPTTVKPSIKPATEEPTPPNLRKQIRRKAGL